MRRRIPNILTVLRLLLAAAFFVILEWYRYPHTNAWALYVATGVFVVAALTDALDGKLARRWKVESTFGRVMDPFADKILVLGAFVYLAGPRFALAAPDIGQVSGVAPWMVVVILARELLVTALRGSAESAGVKFGAVRAGKLKMVLQSVTVPAVLLLIAIADPAHSTWSAVVRDILVWATVVVTILSGWPYVVSARRALSG
ncbi:MAG: CDP-diacylglycerol--glycerol-3-phosphate 3-phosphatidyltransferase [Phycisphaerales bacterium]|nr:CDP-diacylglycerol--glycerol-3-phosphate 3-phosphatidyltransferase [Phycisphaerales bacterium]